MTPGAQTSEAKTITWSARRINRLAEALQSRRYLEVGVNRGVTFRDVTVAERVAVDPRFLFEYKEYANPQTSFHEMTSDRYFATLAKNAQFDIYFLDGLHTFEQTLRDFCNTLAHSHARTVWLIDDTKPNDPFSALPDQSRALRFRKAAGSNGQAWHGDVFKLVYFLHDFFPGMNYRTISTGGNRQTLVWRSNLGWREPRYNDVEKISRLTYFDMHDSIEVLREEAEDVALDLCIAELLGEGS